MVKKREGNIKKFDFYLLNKKLDDNKILLNYNINNNSLIYQKLNLNGGILNGFQNNSINITPNLTSENIIDYIYVKVYNKQKK